MCDMIELESKGELRKIIKVSEVEAVLEAEIIAILERMSQLEMKDDD